MPRVTITVPDKNAQPYRFQLDREIVRLGRGSDNDIVIDSGSVSTNHAEMRRITGGYELQDIGSTNGIKLDGMRHEVIPLYHGTTAYLGDVAFDFSLTDEEQEMLDQESPTRSEIIADPEGPISTQPLGKAAKPKVAPKRQVTRAEEDAGSGFMPALLLILFAVAAFGIGASVRFKKETDGSWIEAIKAKYSSAKKPAAPATAAPAAEPEIPAEATTSAPPPPAPVPVTPPPAPAPAPAGDSAPPPAQ